jgi:hypothetical protein
MTLDEFRKATANMDGNLEVLIRWSGEDCSHVSSINSPTVEQGCTDVPALMLDAAAEEEEE